MIPPSLPVMLNDTKNLKYWNSGKILECWNIKKIFSSCLSDIKLYLIRCEANYNWEPSNLVSERQELNIFLISSIPVFFQYSSIPDFQYRLKHWLELKPSNFKAFLASG